VLDRVYRAVAWQRVDQIRYNILKVDYDWKVCFIIRSWCIFKDVLDTSYLALGVKVTCEPATGRPSFLSHKIEMGKI
jgi:hypothetical protein